MGLFTRESRVPPPPEVIGPPMHPRLKAHLLAMTELHEAQRAMAQAQALELRAERARADATDQLTYARRLVRQIAESKVAPEDAD